ncbi:MAG: lysophospholipase [Acidobacteriota bacterium]
MALPSWLSPPWRGLALQDATTAFGSQALTRRRTTSERTSHDGLRLVARTWMPEEGASLHAVVVIAHGLSEHGDRYGRLASVLTDRGFAVTAPDHRGHGLSGGRRGHVANTDVYRRDLALHLADARRTFPTLPLVLYGHSMGGVIALDTVLWLQDRLDAGDAVGDIDPPPSVDGLAVSSPGLGTHADIRPSDWLHRASTLLSRFAPWLSVPTGIDPQFISRDPRVVADFESDPLVNRRVTPRWYTSFLAMRRRIRHRAADLRLPTLLMQAGGDRIVQPEAARRFAESSAGRVAYREFAGLAHQLHDEPERAEVFAVILAWLDEQILSVAG